jgi:hypothetical protein
MKRVPTVEIIRHFGYGDAALADPIILTKNGHDRHMIMSIERYDALRRAYDAVHGTGATTTHRPRRIKT